MIGVKSNSDIEKMRAAGKITAKVLGLMRQMAVAGMTTAQMDEEAEKLIRLAGAKPSFKGYDGFRFATCMSVEDTVVHGFPSQRPLKEGELLSVDVGVFLDGFHSDAARTFLVGGETAAQTQAQKQRLRLLQTCEESFFEGLKELRPNNKLGDVSAAIQAHVEGRGFSVVRSMTGHGIGRKLHEDPAVNNYGVRGTGVTIKKGWALAIEPMINLGGFETYTEKNGWELKTKDGSPSAHYENTVIVLEGAPEILTLED